MSSSLSSLSVIHYTTENKETCARYVKTRSDAAGIRKLYPKYLELFHINTDLLTRTFPERNIKRKNCNALHMNLSLFVPDSSSSAPRMPSALTMPQASAVTAGLASMETDATVYLRVRPLPLTLIVFQFLNVVVNGSMSLSSVVNDVFGVNPALLLQVLPSVSAVR